VRRRKHFFKREKEKSNKSIMGTVLSFSPRERRPIYSSTHHHHHRGSGSISTSNSTSDFQLNNYAYEQINNVKNRENMKPMQYLSVPNQFQLQNGSNGVGGGGSGGGGSVVVLGSNGSNVATTIDERQADSARILSEKNAIEKSFKKHSLFINALSWKRLSSSHGKKKLESNNAKNKTSNITSGGFRPTLTDTVHPMMVVNDKKKYPQQQVQLIASSNSASTNNVVASSKPLPNYFSAANGDLALDLQNANHTYQNIGPKVSIPIRPIQLATSTSSNVIDHQQLQNAPKKTIIQVSLFYLIELRSVHTHKFDLKALNNVILLSSSLRD
jgi:cyclin-dependent kinase 5 activator 1